MGKRKRRTPIFFDKPVGSRGGSRPITASKMNELLPLVAGLAFILREYIRNTSETRFWTTVIQITIDATMIPMMIIVIVIKNMILIIIVIVMIIMTVVIAILIIKTRILIIVIYIFVTVNNSLTSYNI